MDHPVRGADPASLAVAALLDDLAGEGERLTAEALRAGSLHAAIALSEPDAGSDLSASRVHARHEGDMWALDGQKKYIAGGADADQLLILARTDAAEPPERGFTAFLIPRDTPGVTFQSIEDVVGRHAFDKIFLEDVRLPASARLGEDGRGWFLGERLREDWLAPSAASRIVSLDARWAAVREDDGGASRARAAQALIAARVAEMLIVSGRVRAGHLVSVVAAQHAWCAGGRLPDGLLGAEGDGPVERGVEAQAAGVAQGALELHRNAIARDLGLPG